DGARVQTASARADELLALASLDDGDVDPRQRQLARQHQTGRASAGDQYRMLRHPRVQHTHSAHLARYENAQYEARPGPCCKPPVDLYIESGKGARAKAHGLFCLRFYPRARILNVLAEDYGERYGQRETKENNCELG